MFQSSDDKTWVNKPGNFFRMREIPVTTNINMSLSFFCMDMIKASNNFPFSGLGGRSNDLSFFFLGVFSYSWLTEISRKRHKNSTTRLTWDPLSLWVFLALTRATIVCVNQSLVFDRKNGSGWSRYLARAHRIWKKVDFSKIEINIKGRSVTFRKCSKVNDVS